MKTQNSSQHLQQNQKIRHQILSLLEDDHITKKQILETIEKEFDVNKPQIRTIMREMRSDFVKKLKILQSGIVGI